MEKTFSIRLINLIKFIRTFGFINGIINTIKLHLLKKEYFRFTGYPNKIRLRRGTSDLGMLMEVIVNPEYILNNIKQPKVIIDAGANIGMATLLFHKNYPGAKIYSLEPEPNNFQQLCLHTKNIDHVTTINKGLWGSSTNLKIINRVDQACGFEITETDNPEEATIQTTTIQELMSTYHIDKIDMLKIDIEGSEENVFKNDTSWLDHCENIIIELHDRMTPNSSKYVFEKMLQHQFYVYCCRGENLIFSKKINFL